MSYRAVVSFLCALVATSALANDAFDENHAFKPDKVDAVIAIANQELARDPKSDRSLMFRGLAFLQKGDLAQAISDYEAAIAINPIDIAALPTVIFKQIYPKYASLAQNGDSKTEYGVGNLFRWHCDDVRDRVDQSVTKDQCKELADALLQRSAEHGFYVAQREFGKKIFDDAIARSPGKCNFQFADVRQARIWLLRAAEQDDADAMSEMAFTYVPTAENCSYQDHFKAMEWFQKSVSRLKDAGKASGLFYDWTLLYLWKEQVDTGVDLMEGRYVPQNFEQAAKWLTLAAAHGSPEAQYRLGQLYLRGQGVANNETEALKWFILASSKKPDAATQRDRLNNALSSAQVAIAQREASAVLEEYKKSEWYTLEKY